MARARRGKVKATKDEKNTGKGKKGKGKATEYFAGYCFLCKAWGHMEKDCWWNRSNKSGKDAASLETPIMPATNTTTEPPIGAHIREYSAEIEACINATQQRVQDEDQDENVAE